MWEDARLCDAAELVNLGFLEGAASSQVSAASFASDVACNGGALREGLSVGEFAQWEVPVGFFGLQICAVGKFGFGSDVH